MKPLLIQPTQQQVKDALLNWQACAAHAEEPTWSDTEWNLDHRNYVIGVVMPDVQPPFIIRRVVCEAYLSILRYDDATPEPYYTTFERRSDGSTFVRDSRRRGRTKDWQGIAHDYLTELNRLGIPDIWGKRWTYFEAADLYRDAWRADWQPARAWAWWVGLTAGGWVAWNAEPLTRIS